MRAYEPLHASLRGDVSTGDYPNPFGEETMLALTTKEPRIITLEVFDVIGCKVNPVADRHYTSGVHKVRWNAGQIPGGVYSFACSQKAIQSVCKRWSGSKIKHRGLGSPKPSKQMRDSVI